MVFAKKYRTKNYTASPKTLAQALREYEIFLRTSTPKPWWYFRLKTDIDSDNSYAAAQAIAVEQRINAAGNQVAFFLLGVGAIPPTRRKLFLRDPSLARFSYFLKTVFDHSQHMLSEKEEQLETLLSQTSFTMWVERHKQLVNQQTVVFKGKTLPVSEALSRLSDLPKTDRHVLQKKINERFKAVSHSAEGELNAIFAYRKVVDERRGYKYPFSASLLEKENDEKEILDLVSVVKEYFPVSKRFYRLHAKLLGEKKIAWPDYRAKIGNIQRSFDFDTAVEIVKNGLSKVDPEYGAILMRYLKEGHIDVYPRKGKNAGGYCWGMGELPIFILLNHTGTIDSVETLAHEMGHAIHGELDAALPFHYQDHSAAVAEVASIFFEQLVTDELLPTLSEKEQLVLLHKKINGDIYVVFGQIIGFNYELELHETARREGQVTKEKMAALMKKHLESYLGDAVMVTEDDSYRYVMWMHLRLVFYLYSYAYGYLVSRALYELWKKDHSFANQIRQFLSAGKSMNPKDIFKSIGITVDKKFFETGLKGIEEDISKLEKLAKKLKKIQ